MFPCELYVYLFSSVKEFRIDCKCTNKNKETTLSLVRKTLKYLNFTTWAVRAFSP